MKLLFNQINNLETIECETIKNLTKSAKSNISREFVVLLGEAEVGFLSLEFWRAKKLGFIYEIYVKPKCRNLGIGKLVVDFAEQQVIKNGFEKIQLEIHSFDRTKSVDQLLSWYLNQNYTITAENSLILVKLLQEK